eukprot:COSAG01_NODE_1642_length_9641_cov_14.964682_11_plen_125_part_00
MTYLDGRMLEDEARHQLRLAGIDLDAGTSVRDLLKQGADSVQNSTQQQQQQQQPGQGGGLLGEESSALGGGQLRSTVGQALLRWVGLDWVLTLGNAWLQLRSTLGVGAARVVRRPLRLFGRLFD